MGRRGETSAVSAAQHFENMGQAERENGKVGMIERMLIG